MKREILQRLQTIFITDSLSFDNTVACVICFSIVPGIRVVSGGVSGKKAFFVRGFEADENEKQAFFLPYVKFFLQFFYHYIFII